MEMVLSLPHNRVKKDYLSYPFAFFVIALFAFSKSFTLPQLSYLAGALCISFILLASLEKGIQLLFIVCPNTYFAMIGSTAICGWIAIALTFKIIFLKQIAMQKKALVLFSLVAYSVLIYFLFGYQTFLSSSIKIFGLLFVVLTFPSFIACKEKNTLRDMTIRLIDCYVLGTILGILFGYMHYFVNGLSIIASNIYSSRFGKRS